MRGPIQIYSLYGKGAKINVWFGPNVSSPYLFTGRRAAGRQLKGEAETTLMVQPVGNGRADH
jgi:hypothetical protein